MSAARLTRQVTALNFLSKIDLTPLQKLMALARSAYIHIPFCRHRCGYCNFSLVAGRDHLVDRFLSALAIEIQRLGAADQIELDTLFFGGGTPSHLSPNQLDRLQQIVASKFTLAANAEVSAECNPNDIDKEKTKALKRLGVNRISLGVQSLNPLKLKQLERDHSPNDVATAVQLAKQNMASVSMDLIFAAPGETLPQWQADLEAAMSLEPNHLSTYELTYEKGTRFWNRLQHGKLAIAVEDDRADMYEHTIERLGLGEWSQYELSSFSQTGHQCRHNHNYWNGNDYYAFGPGASRYINGIRSTNHQSTMQYLKRLETGEDPTDHVEQLTGRAAARERLAVGLRLLKGVEIDSFETTTGIHFSAALPNATRQSLTDHGLIEISHGVCKLTRRGVMVSDGVASEILSP